jgi:hypothetical protein
MIDPDAAADALFVMDGHHYLPTHFTEGPWDPEAQFGGAPAALLATLVEDTPTLVPMQIARFTVDLLRPVPLTPLHASLRVTREGKRIQVVDASLWSGESEVARCSALRVRLVDLGGVDIPTGEDPVGLPESPRPDSLEMYPGRTPPGSRWAVEYLHQDRGGYFLDPLWVRLRVAVVAGRAASAMAQLAYIADLASGIGMGHGQGLRSINADLSLNVLRYPVGEWISLTGTSLISREGIGHSFATASDTGGVVANLALTRLIDRAD